MRLQRAWDVLALCLASEACGGRIADADATTAADGTADSVTPTTSEGASTSTGGRPSQEFPCDEALFGRWEVWEIDRVGDLDGDGVHEIAVLGTEPGEETPQVFIFNADAPQVGDGTLTERMVQRVVFGAGFPRLDATRVAGVGDVDGDGVADVAVATFVLDDFGMRARVYVLLADASPSDTREIRIDGHDGPAWVLEGPRNQFPTDDKFAQRALALAAVGDMNGDGHGDIFVQPADGTTFWIAYGRADAGGSTLLGDLAASGDGFRVRYADTITGMPRDAVPVGDVDGDGRSDLAVGNPEFSSNQGQLSILLTAPDPVDGDVRDGAPGITQVTGDSSGFRLGFSVVAVGERDGRPGSEVWIGAPGEEGLAPPCAATDTDNSVFLLLGGPSTTSTASQLGVGSGGAALQGPCGIGVDMSVGGDLDDDGAPDLVATAFPGLLLWFDGALLDSLGPLSVGSGAHRVVDFCRDPTGDDLAPVGNAYGGVLPGPDVDGDAVDDLVVIANTSPITKARVAILPGDARWHDTP